MATDAKGHTVPAAGDAPSRAALTTLSLSIRDVIYVANTTARGTVATAVTPTSSNPLYTHRADAGLGCELEVTTDGSTWRTIPSTRAPAAYTPALTGATTNPTLGTGSSSIGTWQDIGKKITGKFDIVFGSSGVAAGSGAYSISLPTAAASSTDGLILGVGYIVDVSGASLKQVVVRLVTTTTAQLFIDGSTSPISNSNPWVWAATDQIRGSFDYFGA